MITKDENTGGYERTVTVACEECRVERIISWHFARQSETHICRSCSSKKMIQEHPDSFSKCVRAMADANRNKARNGEGRIQSGYKQIYMPEHPMATGGGRKKVQSNGQFYESYGQYIYEHNWVIEQETGAYPEKHEIVHHINGDKLDNRFKNLYLCSGKDRKESAQIHNQCHHSAEKLTLELLKKGLVDFKHGEYFLKPDVAALFADVFER